MTPVIFRYWPKEKAVIAFFPDTYSHTNPSRMMSYMHIGQHGESDYLALLSCTKLADQAMYQPLLDELKSIGYDDLVIYRKVPRHFKP